MCSWSRRKTSCGSGSRNGPIWDYVTYIGADAKPLTAPRVAIVDPELPLTMPPWTTAMTGFDTLTHGIALFLNVERSTPASELFALEAVRRVAAHLPTAIRDGGNRTARAEMAWAATCGRLAIGLANAAVAHAMALPLGARPGTPHGLAPAVVLAHTWEAQPERCGILAEALGGRPVAHVPAGAGLPGLAAGPG